VSLIKLMSVVAEPVCFSNESGKTSVDCLSGILYGKVNFLFSLQFLLFILSCTHFLAACDYLMPENFLR